MKKHRAFWVILIVVVVLAAAAAGVWYWLSSRTAQAEQLHQTVYAQYETMTAAVGQAALTVTEDGSPAGEYDLQVLGLYDDLMNKVTAQFSETDRMTDEQFAALGIREKLDWAKREHAAPYATPDSLFRTALAELEVKVTFNEEAAKYLPHGEETLTSHDLASIVDLDPDGTVTVDEKVLGEKVSQWAQSYSKHDAPFLFDSWVKGLTEIDFVTCDYLIDAQAVTEQIREQLLTMQSGTLSAEADCYDKNGEPFSLGDSYVEVDFDNQQMTFIKDGRLVVNTNIVTGALNGHQTPTGLYETHGKEHDVWLKGDDYLVFVKYWVSVVGDIIGLHDASWRENFGASFYVYGGSHGCVNTPEEAMAMIWNLVEDGTPVLMHGVNQWYEPANGNPRETKNPVRGTTSKVDVPNGTRVLEPGSSRIEIQPDDVVPFELPKEAEQGEETPSNTEATAKPVS